MHIHFSLRTLLWVVFSALLLPSCKKPNNNTTPKINDPIVDPVVVNTDKSNLKRLFASFDTAPQYYTVITGTEVNITGEKGTRIRFYDSSFKDSAGNYLLNDTLNVTMTEIYTPGDMIANGIVATTGNDKLLTSRGQAYLKVTRKGKEVFANRFGIDFWQSAPSAQKTAIHYGTAANADSLVNWTMVDTVRYIGNTAANTLFDSAFGSFYVFDSCPRFNWLSCGYPISSSNAVTNINITVPDTTFNPSNTRLFIYFPDMKSLHAFKYFDAATRTFNLGTSASWIPINWNATLVIMASKNGQFYYYEQKKITTALGQSFTPSILPQSATYIADKLKGL